MRELIKQLLNEGLNQINTFITESNNIQVNSKAEIDRIKMLDNDAEDGVTLNLDGTKYEGTGLVIPVASVNLTQETLSTNTLIKFMQNNAKNISNDGNFKFGLYKFPNSNTVSIDLNIIADEANRDVALEFGRRAGQESLFNLSRFTNEKTGASGTNPRTFTPQQYREIATSLNNGKLPHAVQNRMNENQQMAEKIYLKTGKLSPEEMERIVAITHGDNTTKLIADLYYNETNHGWDVDKLPMIHQQLLSYNKNLFPIKNFDVYNKSNNLTIGLFIKRQSVLDNMAKLPSIAKRNMRREIATPRDYNEFSQYANDLDYFLAQYSLLSNRNEKFRKSIEKKMFKADITLDDLIDFAGEKENMIGGGNVTRNMINKVVKENYYDLEIVYNKGNIMVIDVTSPDGIKAIGCNSLWCFTYGSGFDAAYRQWNNYSTNDHVYVIIDFNESSDSTEFMHVMITPINPDRDEDTEHTSIYDMSNEALYDPQSFIENKIGLETARKILTFGEEPKEEKQKPFVDPNQLSLFEQLKKRLYENIDWFTRYQNELESDGFEAEFNPVNDKLVTIEIIGIPKSLHGHGYGTKIMNQLCTSADNLKIVLQLRPSASSTHSRGKLINFYSKFGFVENKGENLRPEYQYMYRLPK